MNFTIFNPGNIKPFTKRKYTDCIILHHAAAVHCTPADIVKWHLARGFNGAGYNFFITKDGTIYQLRPIWATGAHTIGWNSRSIGICAEGNYETESVMPEVQAKTIAGVIDYCNGTCKKELPLYGHKNKWPTACPGKNYPFVHIKYLAAHWDDKPDIPYQERAIKYTKPTMKGTDVRAVQQRLNDLGFNCGLTDGSYGPKTLKAVVSFQKAMKIKVDGKVGPQTWSKLFN